MSPILLLILLLGTCIQYTQAQTCNQFQVQKSGVALFTVDYTSGTATSKGYLHVNSSEFIVGNSNSVSGTSAGNSSIAGGEMNTLTNSPLSLIGNGNGNSITGSQNAFIGGGQGNQISSANHAIIVGGVQSTITGVDFGFIGGGVGHYLAGEWGIIAGGQNNAISGTPGLAEWGSIGGGQYNTIIDSPYATITGGDSHTISGSSWKATIGGGTTNTIDASPDAVISGGYQNSISDASYDAVIAGGSFNTVAALKGIISGGYYNTVTGSYAAVSGGAYNTAGGDYSFVGGRNANDGGLDGVFMWSDSTATTGPLTATVANSFVVSATGGVYFYTSPGLSTTFGAELAPGGTSWSTISDRNLKTNIVEVDYVNVLEKLVNDVPIFHWAYKVSDEIPHMGPMAQDFGAAYQLSNTTTKISTSDADGVALAAIHGLYKINQQQAAEIKDLTDRVNKLEQLVNALLAQKQM